MDVELQGWPVLNEDLCCLPDGLTTGVSDDTILRVVLESSDLQTVSHQLITVANDARGSDNTTVVVVKVTQGIRPLGSPHGLPAFGPPQWTLWNTDVAARFTTHTPRRDRPQAAQSAHFLARPSPSAEHRRRSPSERPCGLRPPCSHRQQCRTCGSIEDLGSRSGTFVNEQTIDRRRLCDADAASGTYRLMFRRSTEGVAGSSHARNHAWRYTRGRVPPAGNARHSRPIAHRHRRDPLGANRSGTVPIDQTDLSGRRAG